MGLRFRDDTTLSLWVGPAPDGKLASTIFANITFAFTEGTGCKKDTADLSSRLVFVARFHLWLWEAKSSQPTEQ